MSTGVAPVLDPVRTRRLLVVRLDNLGDVVLVTPLLRALRGALPRAAITLLASPAGARLAPLLPWVDEVRPVRALWQDADGRLAFDPARERALVADLAAGRHDAAVISTSFSQSPHPAAYACYLAGIGIRAALSPDFAGGVLSHPLAPPPPGGHQAERALALAAGLGVPVTDRHLALALPPDAVGGAARLLARRGVTGRYAVAAPGASCPSRRYDPDRFAAVVDGLARHLPVVVVGGPGEGELAARVAGPAGTALAGATSVPELAAVVAGAAVVVTGNSGPMHLADALRRPTVALFAGTELESEYAPRAARLRLLRRPTGCSPCRALDCPYAMECLDLDPAVVVRAAVDLLATADDAPRSPVCARSAS